MELRTVFVRAALTVGVILGLFWGIWLAGWMAFSLGGEEPPARGPGVPTTVTTTD
jgi:hypothetical protein